MTQTPTLRKHTPALDFTLTPILGMLHLGGSRPVQQAFDELAIYEEEGLSGAIVENYFSSKDILEATLEQIAKRGSSIHIGVNVLPNEFNEAFKLAQTYGATFIQLDHVAGQYLLDTEEEEENTQDANHAPAPYLTLNAQEYLAQKNSHPTIQVLGGVWPKYYTSRPTSNLEFDLAQGAERAHAVVVTGTGTGEETPLEKIRAFKKFLPHTPLIIGAGLNAKNAYAQLLQADGAIVGSAFKYDGDAREDVDRLRVRKFMHVIEELRNYKAEKNI